MPDQEPSPPPLPRYTIEFDGVNYWAYEDGVVMMGPLCETEREARELIKKRPLNPPYTIAVEG